MRKIAGTDMGELRALAADSTGNIYATDLDKLCVHAFSHQGDHLRSFGCNHFEETTWLVCSWTVKCAIVLLIMCVSSPQRVSL